MVSVPSELPKLMYRDVEMNQIPTSGVPLHDIALNLRMGRVQYMTLEPGDLTRYDLVLTPMNWSGEVMKMDVLVTRLVSGDVLGTVRVFTTQHPGHIRMDVNEVLSNKNQWSEQLLTWWLEVLLVHLSHLALR